jgi:multidrug efflux pump subunit AcrB
MIGMIALAGIIVRNSILLVDFANLKVEEGVAFRDAVMQSAAARAKPIALTGLAAMLGAMFILDDPIFNGLAISLMAYRGRFERPARNALPPAGGNAGAGA